jgi:hypothetical protein
MTTTVLWICIAIMLLISVGIFIKLMLINRDTTLKDKVAMYRTVLDQEYGKFGKLKEDYANLKRKYSDVASTLTNLKIYNQNIINDNQELLDQQAALQKELNLATKAFEELSIKAAKRKEYKYFGDFYLIKGNFYSVSSNLAIVKKAKEAEADVFIVFI